MNIHQLAFNGDLEGIRRTLAVSPDQVNQPLELQDDDSTHRITPIFLAAIQGHVDAVKLFLEQQAALQSPDETDHLSDWMDYCHAKKRIEVFSLLSTHLEMNDLDPYQGSLEEYQRKDAALFGLLEKHFSSEKRTAGGARDYYLLLGERGDLAIVKKWLDTPHFNEEYREAILEGALCHSRTDILQLFAELNFDFTTVFKSGRFAGNIPSLVAVRYSTLEAIQWLQSAKVDFLSPQVDGKYEGVTPLYVAAARDRVEVLQYIHGLGAQLELPLRLGDYWGHTLAYAAVKTGCIKVLEYLHQEHVDLSAPISFGVSEGETLAFVAASQGQTEVLHWLHQKGVSIFESVKTGRFSGTRPIEMAAALNKVKVIKSYQECSFNFLEKGSNEIARIVYAAARENAVAVLEFLHSLHVDVNQPLLLGPSKGETPLFIATKYGHLETIQFFIRLNDGLEVPFKEGIFKDTTPAFVAARYNQVDLLKYFHQIGMNLKAPMRGGICHGQTVGYAAAAYGHYKVIEFLGSIGVDLSEKIHEGEHRGHTLAYAAAYEGYIEVLKVLKKAGVSLLEKISEGPRKGINILFGAAAHNKLSVLEYLKSEGLYRRFMPAIPDKQLKDRVLNAYRQVALPTDQESSSLLCRKIQDDPAWFRIYKQEFMEFMKEIPSEVWAEVGTWNELIHIDRAQRSAGGDHPDWLADVFVLCINRSKAEIQLKDVVPQLQNGSIERVQGVVQPGNSLLQLLEWVGSDALILKNSHPGQLEAWIHGVLKQPSPDDEFWSKAKGYFQKIHAGIKVKQVQKYVRGKGKGKQKPQQDPFVNLWMRFDQKIKDAVTPPEELEMIRERKFRESEEEVDTWIRQLDPLAESLIRPIEGSLEDEDQAIAQFNTQVKDLFIELIGNIVALNQSYLEKRQGIAEIKQRSKLNSSLDAFHQSKMEALHALKNQIIRQVDIKKEELNQTLSELHSQREFTSDQQAMLAETLALDLSEWEKIKTTLEQKATTLWEERQNLARQAKNRDDLNSIRAKYTSLLEDSQKVQTVTTMPRVSDYVAQRNEALLKENKALRKQVEQLEKKTSDRPRSPDKIAPIVEQPTQVALIEKLSILAGLSKRFKRALNMINAEGKILTSVDDLVKFLGLFKFELKNTVGSHRQYSDGTFHVTIANHTGESKPEEIEDVLRAVLSKLP